MMISVKKIELTNSDKDFVDIARVSYDTPQKPWDDKKDSGLIRYLVENKHWTPFAHNVLKFKVSQSEYNTLLIDCPRNLLNGHFYDREKEEMTHSAWGWTQIILKFEEYYSKYGRSESHPAILLSDVIDYIWTIFPFFFATSLPYPYMKDAEHKTKDQILEKIENTGFHTFQFEMPVFAARQWLRTEDLRVFNERSGRYYTKDPTFYLPESFKSRPNGSLKQGSGDCLTPEKNAKWQGIFKEEYERILKIYKEALSDGVAPEEARMLLPQSMMTKFVWTAHESTIYRIILQRTQSDVQTVTREVAEMLKKEMEK
jgi:thymidylate synthase ThyX